MPVAAQAIPRDNIQFAPACDCGRMEETNDCGRVFAPAIALAGGYWPSWPGWVMRLLGDAAPQEGVGSPRRAAQRQRGTASAGGTIGFLVGLLALILVAGRWDTSGGGLPVQWAIAAITWSFLLVTLWRGPARYRLPTLALVLVATGFECLGSLIWRAYEYRLHNLPMYVPPGHGLFYLGALRLADLPAVRRHAEAVIAAVAALATGWLLYGLTAGALPDLLGALCWLLLLGFLGYGRDPLLFALTFCLTMVLEFYGTAMGIWHWAPILPGTHLPAANPPAAIGAGYCVLDAVAACLVQWAAGALRTTKQGVVRAFEDRTVATP